MANQGAAHLVLLPVFCGVPLLLRNNVVSLHYYLVQSRMSLEEKIGFNEIRAMLHGYCLSPLGHEKVDAMQFVADHVAVTTLHQQLSELSYILQTSTEQPEQDFFDLRSEVHRIRIEGAYPLQLLESH